MRMGYIYEMAGGYGLDAKRKKKTRSLDQPTASARPLYNEMKVKGYETRCE